MDNVKMMVPYYGINISGAEYSALIRAAAQLDMLLTMAVNNGYCDTSLVRSIAKERGITAERKVEDDGNRKEILLDEAERKLHDVGHD